MKLPSQRTVLWVAFYGVLSGIFCAPLLRVPQATGILDWDQHLFYYGAVFKSVVEYAAPPFWNPWYCGGNVLWQNPQIALLSPVYPLALAMSIPLAMKINIVLHYWAGLIGMHLLLTRVIRLTFLPLVVYLGVLFTCSGALALHIAVGHSVFLPAFYLPFQLFFFLRALQTGRVRDALSAGAVLALLIYNGGLHIVSMSIAAVGICALAASIARRAWRPLLLGLVFVVIGCAYAAPKLLPVTRFASSPRFWDTRSPTERPDRTTVEMLRHVYLDENQNRSLRFEGQRHGWHEYGNYIGSFGAVLIAASIVWVLLFRDTPDWWLGAALALTSLLLLTWSAGEFSPYAPATLTTHLPLFSQFRVPSRYTIVFVLFAATTVGWAARAIVTHEAFTARAQGLAAIVCVLASVQVIVRNRSHLESVFAGPIPTAGFRWLRGSDTLASDLNANPYGPDSPMFTSLVNGRSFYACYESLQLIHTADPDNPLVFSNERSTISAIRFSPNRVEFSAVAGPEPSRIFLNQNYAEGWRSDVGPVMAYLQIGKPTATLPAGRAGRFSFSFVPPGLTLGMLLWAVAMVASVVSGRGR